MDFINYTYELMIIIWEYHFLILVSLTSILLLFLGFWSFQRNPIPTIKGFESPDKAKEISPEIFGEPEKQDEKQHPSQEN